MFVHFIVLSLAISQGINLAASDLSQPAWSVSEWSATTSDGITVASYNSFSSQCNNQNMLVLDNNYQTYSKTYTITDYEFYQLFIELDVYFYQFTQTTINMIVNTQNIYSQQFTSSILTLNNICGTGLDSQYTIYQGFYTTQQTLQIQIQYIQDVANENSFIGIQNLNIYSNGIPLIGGCPMNTPLLQLGSCVAQCTTTYTYLTGQYWNQCTAGTNSQTRMRFYLETDAIIFKIFNIYPSDLEQLYLEGEEGSTWNISNSNIYTSIMHSNLFKLQFQSKDVYYYMYFETIGPSHYFQWIFVFYVFGEWDDGSFVQFYLAGNQYYSNTMITISKQYGQYYSSTQSQFYNTNVTQNGINTVARKTLISLSALFFTSDVQLSVIQYPSGSTASYGYGNILVHRASSSANFQFSTTYTDIYGLPYSCDSSLYAYNGTCVETCPVFSFTSATNKNCTDYSSSESSIYNAAIPISQNAYGIYIIKLFYQNNFQKSDIDSLFQTKPPSYKNYLNSESFSFIQSKKILGGYNSWGYGTYQTTFSNLKAHFQVRFFFRLYLIDGWQAGDTFTYQVDGAVVDTYTSNPSLQYQGLSTLDSINIISGRKISHGSSTMSITFNCNIAQKDASKASCGIQNLFVLIDQNVNILCPPNNKYFSFTTQNCETCYNQPCTLYPKKQISYKCSIGCLICNSNTVCTSCDSQNGYQLFGSACTCLSNYIMVSSICQKCYYQCATCSGIAYNQCNSCGATRNLSSNICPCNQNYYDIISIATCAPITSSCHYSCSTCFGQQYYQCVTCPNQSNRIFQSTSNTCPCNTNFLDIGISQCYSLIPIICDISCLTCSATGNTNCLSCDSSKYRTTLSSGQCPCDSGYNDALNPGVTCVANFSPCHYTCGTCYGSLNTNCLSCPSATFRSLSQNQCKCDIGYVDIETIEYCKFNFSPCIYSCLTCFGPSQAECLTCPATRDMIVNMIGIDQMCQCQDGLYDNLVATCAVCDSSCKTCSAAGSNSCSSCEAANNRFLSGTSCPCSIGYNDIISPGSTCVFNHTPCHFSCLTCHQSQSNNCLTCDSSNNRIYQSSTKICQCDANYTDIGLAACLLNFTPCQNDCLTCYGPAQNQCSSCGVGRIINIIQLGIESTCPCDHSYYASGLQCLICHSTCYSCNGSQINNCTGCDGLRYRELISSQCPCFPDFNDILNGTCVNNYIPCHAICKADRTLNSHTCACSTGKNEIVNPGICVDNYFSCHQQCDTCYGGLNNNCVTCNSTNQRAFNSNFNTCPCISNYIDIGQVLCVSLYSPCEASCLTCFGVLIYQCVTCPPTRTLNQVSIGHKSCDCNIRYYEVTGESQCSACHYTCETCSGSFDLDCLTCNASRQIPTSACPCIANYNDLFGTLNDCQLNYFPCHLSCLTCFGSSANQCFDCPSGSFRIFNNTNQTCDCPAGYNSDQTICAYICDITCLTCSGPFYTDCLTCNIDVRQLLGSTCLCNNGTNDKLNPPTCVADITNPSCYDIYVLTCFGNANNEALSCDYSLDRILSNNNICVCNDGFYNYVTNDTCLQCNPSCKTCNQSSRQNCLTCDATKNRVAIIDASNQCPCITNYNDKLNVDEACVSDLTTCYYSCLTCYGIANNQCLTCPLSSFRTLNADIWECNSTYGDAGQAVCVLCHSSCLTCNGTQDNQCLTCSLPLIQINNICQCPNFTDVYINNLCYTLFTPCHYSCLTCINNLNIGCYQCPINRIFHTISGSSKVCNCIDGYFEDVANRNICSQCHYSCLTCQITQQNCLTCSSLKFRQISSNSCPCIQNYKEVNQICITCTNSDCLTCDNLQNCLTCISEIKQVLNGLCICIDGYYLQDANCYKCHSTCLTCNGAGIKQCLSCDSSVQRVINSGMCVCQTGYQENSDRQCTDCYSKEGILIFQCQYKNSQDKVWTYGEQCDDGNTDPRDGCDNQIIQPNYSCINIINEPSICYKCPDNCIKCIYDYDQVICSICQNQYYNAQQSCVKCADNQCQYCATPSSCSICLNNIIPQNGKCFNCQTGFYQVGYICQSECGDGIKTYEEECDDGNLQNGDGCSNQCSIEENFVCQTSSNISSCKMNSPPKLQITPVAMRQTNLKRFNIASNQNVLQQNVSLDIISNQSEFITLQYQVLNQSNESVVAPLQIDVNLTFSKTFDYLDILFVVNGLLNNEFNQDVSSRQLQTPVKDVQIMSNSEKQISSQVSSIIQGSVIAFACASSLSLLLGGTYQFIQFLNMIQQLQYIKICQYLVSSKP
ncbi:hypothetical protein pb186bvf_020548 [Paramecium bursaria]